MEEVNVRRKKKGLHVTISEREQLAMSFASTTLTEYRLPQSGDWVIQREQIVLIGNIAGSGNSDILQGTFRGVRVAVKHIDELVLSPSIRNLYEQ